MKLISWNVNGIRAVLKKGFPDFLSTHDPDILCLQEVKARREQVELESLQKDYEIYWNAALRPGYSGTAVFTRVRPLNVTSGMDSPSVTSLQDAEKLPRWGFGGESGFSPEFEPKHPALPVRGGSVIADHDNEGRVITLEFPEYFLVNVYTPNAGEELKRLPYRLQWDASFRKYAKGLEKKKPVIVCGDLNVAHKEIDLANPDSNHGNSGFTDEERESFSKFLDAGFLDTFREVNPNPHQYSWWTYRFGARSRNVGWRIDYFCISKNLRPLMKDAFIRPEVMGSDHCPVGLLLR